VNANLFALVMSQISVSKVEFKTTRTIERVLAASEFECQHVGYIVVDIQMRKSCGGHEINGFWVCQDIMEHFVTP
jgi:hypothetical protein